MSTPTSAFESGRYRIDALAVAPGGEHVALAASALTGDVWDGRIHVLPAAALPCAVVPSDACTIATRCGNADVAWASARVLVSANDFGDLLFWNAPTAHATDDAPPAEPVRVLGEHTGVVSCVRASADGETLASGGHDGTARVWRTNAVAPESLRTLSHISPSHTWRKLAVHAVAFSGAGHCVATAADDGVARLWDVRAEKPLVCAAPPEDSAVLSALALPADDGRLLVGTEAGEIVAIDWRQPRGAVARAAAHTSGVRALAASEAGLLACASDDGTVSCLHTSSLGVAAEITGAHDAAATAAGWLGPRNKGPRAGAVLLTGGWDGRLLARTVPLPPS